MEDYLGYKEVVISEEEASLLYSGKYENNHEALRNQYVAFLNESGELYEIYKSDGEKLSRATYKNINNAFLGKVSPRNIHQRMAIDMLYDPKTTVKVITGKFGTGKDFLMCGAAAELIEKGKFDKIVYVRNNIEVKDSRPIGHLPGTYNEKLLPFAMPLADHLGGEDGLNYMIAKGQIEIVHLGFIRGRDIKNSIIICSECENMTKEHIQLLIGRVGEGSALWLNGDFKQCDAEVFRENSGLSKVISALKGNELFAYVRLQKTERSKTAALADLLDEV